MSSPKSAFGVLRSQHRAINAETRLVVGWPIGPRDKQTAEDLWFSLPPEYRKRAVCFTDFSQIYASIFPSKRHKAVDKTRGKTSLIERLNNTLRQRCSRLVRKALSFSKKLANHIGPIWYFIHAYNRQRLAQLGLATTKLACNDWKCDEKQMVLAPYLEP